MKKVNTNKVNAEANKKVTKSFKTNAANTKIDANPLTVKPYEGCSVTIENKKFEDMKFWAYHLTKDIDNLCIDVNEAVEDGSNIDFIPYTEDELNEMIEMAGFAINIFDPNDTEVYRWYYNAYGCCRYIIARCMDLIHVLHGNYDAFGCVKPKYDLSTLPIDIERVYHRLYTDVVNVRDNDMFGLSYTRDELYSISGKAARTLNELDNYDCSDVCNVEVTKYFCTEVINMVNNLLDVIDSDAISDKDNKANTKSKATSYDEYDDF